METLTKKIALFKTSWGTVLESTDRVENNSDYTRITEYVDCVFPCLSEETVIRNQVSAIDKSIEKIKEEAMERVSRLQDLKSELLALTHEAES